MFADIPSAQSRSGSGYLVSRSHRGYRRGHGIVIETFAAQGNLADGILLRDYDPRNAQEGRTLIAHRGMCGVARFELGDAFKSRGGACGAEPAPHAWHRFGPLRIVSG